ncbi:MAG: glycosyltransferase family A protein [Saprospiraceae bacterium]|nr:glycosyltransferase family A protein [Saprospiraceae bacterium]
MVTIIIPFFDELNYLEEAITSVLDQRLEDFEILIVCNQAQLPDELPGELPVFNHPSIRWLVEPKRGSAFARNTGLREARGTWLQFLDVDDLLVSSKIKTQLKYPDAAIVVSPHIYHFLSGKEVASAWSPTDIWAGLLASEIGSTSSMLWRKEAVQKVGGWNEAYYSNQEYELIFRILQAGYSVQADAENFTIVRERPSGSITKTARHKPRTGIQLREHIWAFLEQNHLATSTRYRAFQKLVFKNLRALHITDPHEANRLYRQYFDGTAFKPELAAIRIYPLLYHVLGFDLTEKLIRVYRAVRQHIFKSLPFNT